MAVLELGIVRPERFAPPGAQLLFGSGRVERTFLRADEVVAAAEVPLDGKLLRQRGPVDLLRPVVHGEQAVERAAAAAPGHIVAHAVFVRAAAHDRVGAEALKLLPEQLFVERLRVLQIRQTAELAQIQKLRIPPRRNIRERCIKCPACATDFFLFHGKIQPFCALRRPRAQWCLPAVPLPALTPLTQG